MSFYSFVSPAVYKDEICSGLWAHRSCPRDDLQPTYDLEQLQIDYDCQLVDEKLDILARSLKRQVAGMQNEIQQLAA